MASEKLESAESHVAAMFQTLRNRSAGEALELQRERDRAVLEWVKAQGCPHGCVSPCPFHRRIDELIRRLP